MSESEQAAAARSYLYVPGDRPDRLAGSLGRGADAVIADLEDAVALSAKPAARQAVAAWLAGLDRSRCQIWIRVNLSTLGEDVGAIVSRLVTGVVLPKAEPALLGEADAALTAQETRLGLPAGQLRLLPLVETARGLLDAVQLAAGPRVLRLGLGEADLAAELRLRPGPDREELRPLRLQLVLASAAAGIAAPVGPVGTDFRDLTSLRTSTEALLRLGFRARTAIHPAQIPVIHEVMTPDDDELAAARRVVEAFEAAERDGSGVATDEHGRMVDLAVVRSAREVIARAQRS